MAKEIIQQTEGLCKEVANCIRDAYERGYKQGFKDGNYNKEFFCNLNFEHGTNKGLDDAWECVKRIYDLQCDTVKEIFGSIYFKDVLENYSASEAIAKIKEYEEKQKADSEVKVGDEVIDGKVFNSGKGIVTFVSPTVVYVLWYDGSTGRRKLEDIKKTGIHFDQMVEILKQLKGE